MSLQEFDHSLAVDGALLEMPVELIDEISFGNSRSKRNKEDFDEMVESIKDDGIHQNLVVRPSTTDESRYELIAGYGRLEGAKVANLHIVPVKVRHVNDAEAYKIQITENTNREDLSTVDEIKASVKWVSYFDGDHDAAAKKLGWKPDKLQRRLKLGTAIEAVLDALDKEIIQVGHVEYLCQVTESTQAKTLPKIVEEQWSVEELGERMGKIRSALSIAVFDKAECQTCQFNTGYNGQNELFEQADQGKDKCLNKVCWNKKTAEWLDEEKERLEQDYGTVIFLTDKAEMRNTVSEEAVGKKQYETGCMGCVSNVVLLNNLPRQEGKLLESQCIDTTCFKKCQDKHLKPKATTSKSTTKASNSKASSKTTSKASSKAPAKVVTKTPKTVITKHRIEARDNLVDPLVGNPKFVNVLMASALLEATGSPNSVREKLGGTNRNTEDIALALLDSSEEELSQIMKDSIKHIIEKSKRGMNEYDGYQKMVHKAGKHYGLTDQAIKEWKPSKENLTPYQKGGLEALCKQAKFDKAFNKAKGVGKVDSFAKLMKESKPKLIETILAFDFDWTDFAPTEYCELFK